VLFLKKLRKQDCKASQQHRSEDYSN